MKRLNLITSAIMLALSGILAIAISTQPNSAQVIIVTPLDQGDTTATEEAQEEIYLECIGDCACWFYSFQDADGTQVVQSDCGSIARPVTGTPPILWETPTPVYMGPTLTPTIERVIGRYCFTGSTYQNIRSGASPDHPVTGVLYGGQCLEIVSVQNYPNGDMWLKSLRGWVAYRVNGRQFGNYVQIVEN